MPLSNEEIRNGLNKMAHLGFTDWEYRQGVFTGFAQLEAGGMFTPLHPDSAQLIVTQPLLLAALKRMDALVETLWKSVPWGKTFNLDIQALNEAPLAAKRAIAKAEGR